MPIHPFINRRVWLFSILMLTLPANASFVNRCESPDGAITYTDQSCSEGERFSLQEAYHPPLGSSSSMIPERERLARRPLATGASVVVVTDSTQGSMKKPGSQMGEELKRKKRRTRPPRYSAVE